MGRSVSTHSDSVMNVYFDYSDCEDSLEFELHYEDCIVNNLLYTYPSFNDVRDRGKWPERESKLIVNNRLIDVTLQTYMTVGSVSFVPGYYENLAYSWIMQNREGLRDCIPNRIVKEGTMSNGVSVYREV